MDNDEHGQSSLLVCLHSPSPSCAKALGGHTALEGSQEASGSTQQQSLTREATPGQDWVGGGQVSVPGTPRASEMLPALSAKTEVEDEAVAELEPRVPWYKQRSLQLVLAGYASIAFLMNFLEELTPIFASAPLPPGALLCFILQCTSCRPFRHMTGHAFALTIHLRQDLCAQTAEAVTSHFPCKMALE